MLDFSDIRAASKGELVRAWCVEQATDFLDWRGGIWSAQTLINTAAMIEEYVLDGSTNSSISKAVEEGYAEGLFQAKEAIEVGLDLNLDDLYVKRGWCSPQKETD